MDEGRAGLQGLLGIDHHRQWFVFNPNCIHGVFGAVAIRGDNNRYRLTDIMNFTLGQGRRARALQHRLYSFQPGWGMNLEAFRKWRYPLLDVSPGPHSNNPVDTQSFFDIDGADARVRVHAPQQRSMKHVRQAHIADVRTVPGNETFRFVRLYATANESRRSFRHKDLMLAVKS
jgi:hypothetical protein